MKGFLTIASEGANYSEEITVPAEIDALGGAVRVAYYLDGDKCLLTVAGDTVTQYRKGGIDTVLKFVAGAETPCTVSSGGLETHFSAYTERLLYKETVGGFTLDIRYKSEINGVVRLKIKTTCAETGAKEIYED